MRYLFLIVFTCLISAIYAQNLQSNDSLALLQGTVVDSDGDVVIGETLTFTNLTTKQQFVGVSDGKGKFEFLIPDNADYEVVVKSFGPEKKSKFTLPDFPGPATVPYTMTTKRLSTFQLGVQYKVNSAEIMPDTYSYIDQLFDYMTGKEGVKIEIGGHTDSDGSDEANMKLSKARAESVKTYLVNKGVDTTRITAKGYGESVPIASNDTEEGKQQNRRTEVKILSK